MFRQKEKPCRAHGTNLPAVEVLVEGILLRVCLRIASHIVTEIANGRDALAVADAIRYFRTHRCESLPRAGCLLVGSEGIVRAFRTDVGEVVFVLLLERDVFRDVRQEDVGVRHLRAQRREDVRIHCVRCRDWPNHARDVAARLEPLHGWHRKTGRATMYEAAERLAGHARAVALCVVYVRRLVLAVVQAAVARTESYQHPQCLLLRLRWSVIAWTSATATYMSIAHVLDFRP